MAGLALIALVAMATSLDLVNAGGWANDMDKKFTWQCPANEALTYIYSTHVNYFEDRQWKFACTQMDNKDCRWDSSFTSYDGTFTRECKPDELLAGMESEHSNHYADRIFKFKCCKQDFKCSDIVQCGWTGFINQYDKVLEYRAPSDHIIQGVSSRHDNYYEDRQFKFKICRLQQTGY